MDEREPVGCRDKLKWGAKREGQREREREGER